MNMGITPKKQNALLLRRAFCFTSVVRYDILILLDYTIRRIIGSVIVKLGRMPDVLIAMGVPLS